MENDEDPNIRIATKRVINLYDRRVTKAIVKIKTGSQTGDKLVVVTDELTDRSRQPRKSKHRSYTNR